MCRRRHIQAEHEQYYVEQFILWWQSHCGEQFRVTERPNPPEAIVASSKRTSWIEVTDAFFASEWAAREG